MENSPFIATRNRCSQRVRSRGCFDRLNMTKWKPLVQYTVDKNIKASGIAMFIVANRRCNALPSPIVYFACEIKSGIHEPRIGRQRRFRMFVCTISKYI